MSESATQTNSKRKLSASDIVVYVLAAALLITMGLAAMYGFRYGNVDKSVAVGKFNVVKDGRLALSLTVDEDLKAHVSYFGLELDGTLKLAGAEEDTILFQLIDIESALPSDYEEAPGSGFSTDADAVPEYGKIIFFVRMPRSGLQGDFLGDWMVYFNLPESGVMCSDWIETRQDDYAAVGFRENYNVLNVQRATVYELSEPRPWKRVGNTIFLGSVPKDPEFALPILLRHSFQTIAKPAYQPASALPAFIEQALVLTGYMSPVPDEPAAEAEAVTEG